MTQEAAAVTGRVPRTRWLVGVLTIWPVVYIALFITVVVGKAFSGEGEGIGVWLLVLHVATMLLMFGLLAVYAIDIFRNPAVREDRRVMWLVLVLFLNIGAMPVYWWHYMRRRDTGDAG